MASSKDAGLCGLDLMGLDSKVTMYSTCLGFGSYHGQIGAAFLAVSLFVWMCCIVMPQICSRQPQSPELPTAMIRYAATMASAT